MTNKELYKKTLGFSLRRVLWDILSLVLLLGCSTLGYFLGEKFAQNGIIGLVIGLIVGAILAGLISHFISYLLKAGQIAMMTRGITEGELPDDVIAEGKRAVKERFGAVAVYYAITRAIKAIFNELGKLITRVGQNIGGDTGGAIGGAVSSAVNTVVNYLCDCCLGWIFYRKDVNAAKAGCEGAVLFFKHGKTLAKNMGRVFGIGAISILGIGGVFAGIFYLILSSLSICEPLSQTIAEKMADAEGNLAQILRDPKMVPVVIAVIGGIIVWSIIHSTFIRPFILTGVLRNYINSGINDIPTEDSFAMLDSKSRRFRKLHEKI